MKLRKLILPIAVGAYALYDKLMASKSSYKKELDETLKQIQLSYESQLNTLKSELTKLENEFSANSPQAYTANQLEYSTEVLYSGIDDVYWGSAYYVTIVNPLDRSIEIEGILMRVTVGGVLSDWFPYTTSSITLLPGQSIRKRLSGTTATRLFAEKGDRKTIRKLLKDSGKRVEIKNKVVCDLYIKWNTGQGTPKNIWVEDVSGTLMWTPGVSYAKGKDGKSETSFFGGVDLSTETNKERGSYDE